MPDKVLGAILAGGRARRFGSDKALALLRGVPLIEHVARALAPHVDHIVVSGRAFGAYPSLPDRAGADLGPLAGIDTALAYAAAEGFTRVLTLPCDTPEIDARTIAALTDQSAAAIVAGCPVIGIWPTALGPALGAWLARSPDRSIRGWAAASGAAPLDLPVPANINRVADLARLDEGGG